ncbi:hypothetical protein PG985_003248 [Apiospora marii]|uniref:uncharacterized protein n=1 Tax=Apiospora marii TaxID=335849 RepID=UPI00312EAF1C
MIGLLLAFVIGAGLALGQQQPLVSETFFTPDDAAVTAPDFSVNPVWTIGEVQTIRWTTTSTDYTISLWQQNIDGSGSASQGPTIFQSRTPIAFTQFDWVPQIFHFDLSESNVFFLRLCPGTGVADSGAAETPSSMRSHYFNISVSSSSPAPSPPPPLPPFILPRALTATEGEIDQNTPTIAPSFSALTLDSAPPPPSRIPSQGAQPHPTYIIAGATSSAAEPDPLSTGAKIGIGAGAGVGGIVLITLGVVLTFRRARRRDNAMRMSALKELPTLPRVYQGGGGGGVDSYTHFYQLKDDYPSTISTKGHSHRQVTISETRLGYHPRVAELG